MEIQNVVNIKTAYIFIKTSKKTLVTCAGYILKRIGSRLRKLKITNKGPLSDGKTLGGIGHLTDKMIDKLQNCFGIAIK